MKPTGLIGVLLLLVGIGALAIGRFTYTTEKPVVAVGPLTASVSEQHSVALPDILGFGLIIVGGLLIVLNRRET